MAERIEKKKIQQHAAYKRYTLALRTQAESEGMEKDICANGTLKR